MHELIQIECRFTGPIPSAERWVLRFGGRAAYERARIKAAIRSIEDQCVRLVRRMTPSVALHEEVRALLRERARWAIT